MSRILVEYQRVINEDLKAAGFQMRISNLVKNGNEFYFDFEISGLRKMNEEEKAAIEKIFTKYFPNFKLVNVTNN